ncbi:MAG: type II CRISPR RNA-guided endonuclease Cas9 [Verrucomicrobiota bacterium]|jgi:CRISPR-associated endonuclease Csn1
MNGKGKVLSAETDLQFAFDVGHSSIGWAVVRAPAGQTPALLGCGSVIFAADDCLASERRGFRRQRRHIRATRQRIARMRRLLGHLGVLTNKELEAPGCAWPWLLAARVLRGGKTLTWSELWDALRWYAHNRGYDGNRGWSKHAAASAEDSEKEKRAGELLMAFAKKYGRPGTMAEVFCDVLKVDPLGVVKSSTERVRNLGAAFPREGVEGEVERILRAHMGVLSQVDDRLIQALMRDHTALPSPDLPPPARYGQRLKDGSFSPGGLLFGQLVPRFDNRIIARCPITFERVYQGVKAETGDEAKAKREAEKQAKVPSVACVEFHRFRWAMELAKIKVATGNSHAPRNLTAAERQAVNAEMEKKGYLTPGELKKAVRAQTGGPPDNLDQILTHPDAERALLLDPVRQYIHNDELVSAFWPVLPQRLQKRLSGQWRRGNALTVSELLEDSGQARAGAEAVGERYLDAQNTKKRRKEEPLTRESLLRTVLRVKPTNGRAPHTRAVMREVVDFVFRTDRHPAEEGGPLYRSEAIRQAQLKRALDEQTNNHLVRHRLKLLVGETEEEARKHPKQRRLRGLFRDLVDTYAGGDLRRIARITIEVNRELRQMSGKTAQEQAKLLGQQLAHFKGVARKLAQAYEGLAVHVGPGLIRKGRIAEDLGWTCPYTGKPYDPLDLLHGRVDKDHIIPRSHRASDSLDSLVITFSEVNELKGKRTALRFVEEEQCKPVPGRPELMIKPLSTYRKDVEALETFKGHDDDQRRKKNRKRLLLLRDYVEKEFTPGDLTQTSQLVRLGAQALQKQYAGLPKQPVITSLPGSVTAAVRKSWRLTGCLAVANPQVLNPEEVDNDGRPKVRTKTEIRSITHLHHALDACVLAFASHFLPRDGGVWELLVKRRLSADEQRRARQLLGRTVEITKDGELRLADLPCKLTAQICDRLKERRVVQHLPADLSGLRCKETVWRVFDPTDPHRSTKRLARWLEEKKVPVPAGDANTALIICRKRRNAGTDREEAAGGKVFRETKTWRWVYDLKDRTALLGLAPVGDATTAKLKRIKAVKVLGDNFGLALDPEPTLIRPHKVWHQLEALRRRNGGKTARLLRLGTLIRVETKAARSDYRGTWMVRGMSFKQRDGLVLEIAPPDYVRSRRVPGVFESASVATLLKCGLEIIKPPLCGVAPG